MQFAVLGNPGNRRVRGFVRAVLDQGLPHPIVLSWLDYLAGRLDLGASLPPGCFLRIDSPGENAMVDLLLLERQGLKLRLGDIRWGEIRYGRAWYRAWAGVLAELEEGLQGMELAGVCNAPAAIALMYDKWATHDRLKAVGLPLPRRLGKVESFSRLLGMMAEQKTDQVFLKPFYGSSASGVVAFRRRGDDYSATTSVEMQGTGPDLRLFNSLRLRHYRDPAELELLVDRLAGEDLLAEEWIPKAGFRDATVDLRILVMAGRARHVVLRSSQGPLTNLHLGNARGDVEAFRREVGEERWAHWLQTAERAVAAVPGAGYAGVDLLVANGLEHVYIGELNAFGDLLPGLLHEGEDTWIAFVNAFRG